MYVSNGLDSFSIYLSVALSNFNGWGMSDDRCYWGLLQIRTITVFPHCTLCTHIHMGAAGMCVCACVRVCVRACAWRMPHLLVFLQVSAVCTV